MGEGEPERTISLSVNVLAARGLGPDPKADASASQFTTQVSFEFPTQTDDETPTSAKLTGETPQYGLERSFSWPHQQSTYNLFCMQSIHVTVRRFAPEGVEQPEEGGIPEEGVVYGTCTLPLAGLLEGKTELGDWMELEGVDLGGEEKLLAPGHEVTPLAQGVQRRQQKKRAGTGSALGSQELGLAAVASAATMPTATLRTPPRRHTASLPHPSWPCPLSSGAADASGGPPDSGRRASL